MYDMSKRPNRALFIWMALSNLQTSLSLREREVQCGALSLEQSPIVFGLAGQQFSVKEKL